MRRHRLLTLSFALSLAGPPLAWAALHGAGHTSTVPAAGLNKPQAHAAADTRRRHDGLSMPYFSFGRRATGRG